MRSESDLHRDWLSLLDTDGPFLSVPALKKAWPTGMPAGDRAALDALRDAKPAFEKAWDVWDLAGKATADQAAAALAEYRQARDAWVDVVLRTVLGWKTFYLTPASADVKVHAPDYSVTVSPTGALTRGDVTGALVLVTDPVESLRDPLDDGWAASPVDRMEELLRASGVRVGVVTDGRWWAIVSARPETMVASGITDSQRWIELPVVRDAFISLLRLPRLAGNRTEDLLTTLFGDSVAAAEEITEALGTNVRRAVELLVQALSESALDVRRRGEPDPLPASRDAVYQAAVTMMMRVVFLLFAEERGLLPQTQLFTAGYGISDELDALDQRAREEGAEALDRTHLTWHRLLATSQALYRGASFEDIRIPSYGGSLFDPDRFSFLTTRDAHDTLAVVVSDRVTLEVLRAAQMAELRGEPARRISFRDIDVEQIGYIYEGLLGYSCSDVADVIVGLIGKKGEEPEIPLSLLEDFAARYPKPDALANAIITWAKTEQPAAVAPSKAALAKAFKGSAEVEDADRALRAAVPTDPGLRDRLRPFIGAIRRDLRDRPTVFRPGGLVVVETPSRATAGAHYTPKSLATEVVQHALEPLVYSPGPHQERDQKKWVPVDSDRILELKVADIACGSGAFLVAAARYLSARLVEAWQRQDETGGMTPRELELHAMREVIAKCLYGADINAMAVEMCKLSLWLVSLDPKLPFSFVDDKILHGNSLLGLTDAKQLRYQHIDPAAAHIQQTLSAIDVDGVLREAARLRRNLANEVTNADPQRSAHAKRRQWQRFQQLTAELTDVADAIVAAGLRLGGKPGRALNIAYQALEIALGDAYPDSGLFVNASDRTKLDAIMAAGLTPTVPTDYERWKPLHWVIAVPDVVERGGFDAIIGNPPFLGGSKLTGALGTSIRDWFVDVLAGGLRGKADLVAYFFLRAFSLLTIHGNLGLIATNTIAQGDTREVGLDQIVANGFTIMRAIQSRSWPAASANLEYAAVWGTRNEIAPTTPRVADDAVVDGVSTLLEATGNVHGNPGRLDENKGIGFLGCKPYGLGFILEPEMARSWIEEDRRNSDVLRPYINGEDLNSRSDMSASRWVIDFNDRPEEEAKKYRLPYERALNLVKPERAGRPKAVRDAPWWLFSRSAPGLRKAIAELGETLVMAQVSKTVMPVRVKTSQVFDQKLVIFASDSFASQAVLSSSVHQMWAIKYTATMRTDISYSPSDVFLTFPRPASTGRLAEVGRTLDTERREIMLRRDLGLTKLYNLVNDPDYTDDDIGRMRQIHVELDQAVMDAYGWGDVLLDHGFHTYRQMQRWTVSPAPRMEILDRLLEENLRRAAAQGEASSPAEDEDEEGEDD
ncbi:MAG TPA: DNA methyltransferase [Streptosporangiaceae bacterium]|nr:DNA methyltransferase [Streptosporangiaceae bacterium]